MLLKSEQGFASDVEMIWQFVRGNKGMYNVKNLWFNQVSLKTIGTLIGSVFYPSTSITVLKAVISCGTY